LFITFRAASNLIFFGRQFHVLPDEDAIRAIAAPVL
jgi:hypothetical protein